MIKTTVKVEGMMCKMCEAHVNKAVEKNFDVEKVTSSHESGTTEIISKSELDTEKVKAVITEAGYNAVSAESESYEKKGFSSIFKK